MLDIVKLYESIHAKKYKIFPFHNERKYPYLTQMTSYKILIVGCTSHSKYDTLALADINKLSNVIHKYNLIVLDKYICTIPNNTIKSIIEIIIRNNKSFIFSGYTTFVNMNIDNHNKMFRPIDITKYPFNIKLKPVVISEQYSKKLVLLYIICIAAIIHGNWTDPRILYKVTLLLLLLLMFVFPKKKIVHFVLPEKKE